MQVAYTNENHKRIFLKPSEWVYLDQPAGVFIIYKDPPDFKIVHVGECPEIKAMLKDYPERVLMLLDKRGYRILILEGMRLRDMVRGGVS